MAEVKKTNDPKQDLREKQGSLFKTAAVSAPIAIGGGIGISRLLKSSTHFTQPIERIPNTARSDQIRRFANRYVNPEHAGTFKEWQLDKLAGFSDNTALSSEQIRSSLMRSADKVDPTGLLSNMFNKRLGASPTGQATYRDLIQVMRSNSSVSANRAVGSFLGDINLLEQRAAAGLSIETTPVTPSIERFTSKLQTGDLGARMKADINKIEQLVGAQVQIKELSRADMPGKELQLEFFRASDKKRPWFSLRMPRADKSGIITRGATQQSRYIAGTYGIVNPTTGKLMESFNHEQFMARRASEELVPQIMKARSISDRAVRDAVHTFEQKMIEAPEWIPSIKQGTHQGLDEYTRLRSQVMRLYTPGEEGGLRSINAFESARIVAKGGVMDGGKQIPLFPGHSPAQIAGGTMSTVDPREIFLVPEAGNTGRRPFQRFRLNATPAPGAIEAMGRNPLNQQFAWAADPYGVQTPMERAVYVSDRYATKVAGSGLSPEGQHLVSRSRQAERAMRKWEQFDIAAQDIGEDLRKYVEGASGTTQVNATLPRDSFLGYDPVSKEAVSLGDDTFVASVSGFTQDRQKGDFYRVMGIRDVDRRSQAKVFGATKGMEVSVSSDYIQTVAKERLGMDDMRAGLLDNVDRLVMAGDLKKQRALHYNQMFTSLWRFSKQNAQAGLSQNTLASNFADSPLQTINAMRAKAWMGAEFSDERMLDQIVDVARGSDLSPKQMGRVFGAVPDVFGSIDVMGQLSKAERREINLGISEGFGQFYFEDVVGPGSGKIATMEPRAFELMGAAHWGDTGPVLQNEILERMTAAYPERLQEQRALNEALQSLTKPGTREGAVSLSEMAKRFGTSEGMFPAAGTNVRLPGGLGDLYVPGAATTSQIASMRTGTGSVVNSELGQAYKNVFDVAKQYEDRDVMISELNTQVDGLRRELNKARIGTVTAKGGLLRGRVPGSVFLTALEPTMAQNLGPGEAGITQKYADKALQSMRETGLYADDYIDAMRTSLEAGEAVPGVLGRHPHIGPYSSQATNIRLIKGSQPVVAIGADAQRAMWVPGKLSAGDEWSFAKGAGDVFAGDDSALRRAKNMGAELLDSPVLRGAAVGAAGDVDGDVYSMMFAGPQLGDALDVHLANPNVQREYSAYTVRSQMLKAKTAGGDVSLRMAMAGDIHKLSVTAGGELGKLSSSVDAYRGAVMGGFGNLSSGQEQNALGLLEWLEQTPISSKHIARGKEENLQYLLQNINVALAKKSAGGITTATNQVLASTSGIGRAALEEGFTAAFDSGEIVHAPGINVSEAAQNLVNARHAAETQAIGGLSVDRARGIAAGRIEMNAAETVAFQDPRMLESFAAGQLFEPGAVPGRYAQVAEDVLSMGNRLAQKGKSMLGYAKPLAIGTAVGLGMAMLLSEPPQVLDSGANVPPPVNLRSGTGGASMSTNIHPSTQVSGAPTTDTMMAHANSARISAPSTLQPEGYTVNIHGAMGSMTDHQQLSAHLQSAMGRGGRVNSTVRDMRSSLTPQKLSSMLQD